jgi:hypothetical protein
LLEVLDRLNPTIDELSTAVEEEAKKRPEVLRLMTLGEPQNQPLGADSGGNWASREVSNALVYLRLVFEAVWQADFGRRTSWKMYSGDVPRRSRFRRGRTG